MYCPSYLAGRDCGQSDVTRAGQAGGMLLQEILHMSPCPKHGIDNPHDQCKATWGFPIDQASVNAEHFSRKPRIVFQPWASGQDAASTLDGHPRGRGAMEPAMAAFG